MATSCSWFFLIPWSKCDEILETNVTSRSPEDNITIAFSKKSSFEDIISVKTLLLIEKVIACAFTPLTFLVGGPCNVLCCLVFHRQGLKDRVNVCLFSLALVDLCCNIIWFLIGSYCVVSWLPFRAFSLLWWKWVVLKYIRGSHRGFLSISGVLTTVISVERCVCVVLPLKARKLISTKMMTILIIIIVVSHQILCLIYPTKFDVIIFHNNVTGKPYLSVNKTPFYEQNRRLIKIVQNVIIQGLIPVVTFVVVTIATVITVVELREIVPGRKQGKNGVSTTRSQIRLIKMLVILAIVYIVTTVPTVIMAILQYTVLEFRASGKYMRSYLASYFINLQISMLHTTINFFVYLTRSGRFRSNLLHYLPSYCSRIIPHGHSTDATSGYNLGNLNQRNSKTLTGRSIQTAVVQLSNYTGRTSSLSSASFVSKKYSLSQEGADNKSEEQSTQNYAEEELHTSHHSVTLLPLLSGSFHSVGTTEKDANKDVSGEHPLPSKTKLLDTHTHVEKPSGIESVSSKEKGLENDQETRKIKNESSKTGEPLQKEDTVADTENAALPSKEGTDSMDFQVTHVEQQAKNASHPSKAGTVTTDVKVASVEQQAKNAAHPSKASISTTDVKVAHVELKAKNAAHPSKAKTSTTDVKVTHVKLKAKKAAHSSKAKTSTTDVKVAHVELKAKNAALLSKASTASLDARVALESSRGRSDELPYEELLPQDMGWKCTVS